MLVTMKRNQGLEDGKAFVFLAKNQLLVEMKKETITAGITVGLVLVLVYNYVRQYKKLPGNKIPGPRIYPLLGDPSIIKYLRTKKIHDYRTIMRGLYGNIWKTGLFGKMSITISDADLAKTVLTDKRFVKGDIDNNITAGLLDFALFQLPTGDTWFTHRKLLQPAFGPSHLRDTADKSVSVSLDLVKLWERKFEGKATVVDIHEALTAATLDVIGYIAFGVDLNTIHGKEKDSIWAALPSYTFGRIVQRIPIPHYLWNLWGIGANSKAIVEEREKLHSYMRNLVVKERLKPSENADKGLNVLQRLVQTDKLTEQEIFGEMVGFFLAGHETTSNTLTFTIYELCKNPIIQEKLYREVRNVKANHLQLLSSLNYLDSVIKESQRLHTIVAGINRVAVEDTTLGGFSIPKGVRIVVDIAGIHVNPKYYKNPLEYNPDRWLDQDLKSNAFLPFSDGPHNCIGRKMAIIEAKILLLVLLQNVEFIELKDQIIDKTTQVTSSIRGFKAIVKPRNV